MPPIFFFLCAATVAACFAYAKHAGTALLVAACAASGLFYYHFYFAARAAGISIPFGERFSFSGFVAAEPGHSAKTEYFPLQLASPHRGTVQVFADPGSGLQYGDELQLAGTIERPESERDLPAAFYPKIVKIGSAGGSGLRRSLFAAKRRATGVLAQYLPGEEAAFLGGITLGEKASFSPEFLQALAASGTTHLVALSGYNIAILVLVVFGGLLRAFGRRLAFYATCAAIVLFVLMVGAEPSVVRAAAMGCLALLAREMGRPYGLPFALLWTAFGMVLLDPSSLFAPGFQLSFMALLGIFYLAPVFLDMTGGATNSIKEQAALTIAAQAAVLPIALNDFGSVSLTSVPANLLILPFMPITMLSGFLLIVCGLVAPPFGILVGAVAHILLAYETGVIHIFAVLRVPISGGLPWYAAVLYYLALAALVWRRQRRITRHGGP